MPLESWNRADQPAAAPVCVLSMWICRGCRPRFGADRL